MRSLTTRKTILLSLVVVLLCMYIVQLMQAARSPIQEFTLKESPDQITIASDALGTVVLNKDADSWTLGDKAYPANDNFAQNIAESVMLVRTLGVVSRSTNEESEQRFGMDSLNAITVTASKGGTSLRTLTLGKAASTGDQTYVRIDGKSDILMASGMLRDVFDKTVEELREKQMYSFNSSDITAVHVTAATGDFTVTKSFGENGAVWTLAGAVDTDAASDDDFGGADSSKIASWVTQASSLSAQSFADDGTEFPIESVVGSIELTAGTERVSVTVAQLGGDDADANSETRYLCKASNSPYLFYVSKTTAERLLKDVADFK